MHFIPKDKASSKRPNVLWPPITASATERGAMAFFQLIARRSPFENTPLNGLNLLRAKTVSRQVQSGGRTLVG